MIRHHVGMNRRAPVRRRRSGCGCSLIVLFLLLVGIVVAAEFGARWYLADQVEQKAADRLGAPVSVEFGALPILPGLITERSVDQVRLTSPGNATVPRIDVTGRQVTLVDGAVHAATAAGTATLSGNQLTAAAAQGNPGNDTPLAGLSEVRSVRPDAATGLLHADIGGIAEIGVSPGVTDGQLTLTPQQSALLGFPLPDGLFSGISGTVDSAIASLPDGVVIDGTEVVNDGLEVRLGGTDVVLQ